MKGSLWQFNIFLLFKLPSAWLCGVRLRYIDKRRAVVTVRYRWINQNPFKSMFWAVQGMAAELSTGAMVMAQIGDTGERISMLVQRNKAHFSKKATGKITFACDEGHKIGAAIEQTLATGEGQRFWMQSIGKNEAGETVATFDFEWTIRLKKKPVA